MAGDFRTSILASAAKFVDDAEAGADRSKREFLRAAGMVAGSLILPGGMHGQSTKEDSPTGARAVLVIFGGVRDAESFSAEGIENIPHLAHDLLPQSLFFARARNEGVTAHFNAISSILTGNWQRVDDWGKLAPTTPTLFETYRKQLKVPQSDAWVIASNKALTHLIGASSSSEYGPAYGANVVFPKQLMVAAVVNALHHGRSGNLADRAKVEAELESMLEDSNYEGLGWRVSDAAERLDPRVRTIMEEAIADFVRGGPTSGDELTFLVSREVMRKFSPRLLVVIFSDVEVAHFGSYSLHVAGVRTGDRLTYQLWQEIETNSEYKGRTTMVVLPEFGRDADGSTTNGFFNHRGDSDSTRTTWMMALGTGVVKPQLIDRPIRHVDLCPTLASLLGCRPLESQGAKLPELRA